MLANLNKSEKKIYGDTGLPADYPIPTDVDNLLFYIQRNLNKNTVCYALNLNTLGELDKNYPIKVFWIKYTTGGVQEELNLIQKKAFGYTAYWINKDLFEFRIDSYDKLRFFVAKKDQTYQTVTKINGESSLLKNIYVFANELGIFPEVKFIELYGQQLDCGNKQFERILI